VEAQQPKRASLSAWGVSLAIHAIVVVGAIFVAWSVVPTSDPTDPVIVSFEDVEAAPAAPTRLPEQLATSRVTLPALPQMTVSRAPSSVSAGSARIELDVPRPARQESRVAVPRERRARFAGLGTSNVRDVVYVIDVSASLLSSFPEVRRSLVRSFASLHPTQRFQIVLMRSGADGAVVTPIPGGVDRPILLDATRTLKRASVEWLMTIRPRGRGTSDLKAALDKALSLGPDAIFVLGSITTSDILDVEGTPEQQRDALLAWLDRKNPRDARAGTREVSIKTLQYVEDDPTGIMRRIGFEHGGEDGYRMITLDDLVREEQP
jgi:hypothetical protein